MSAAIESTTSVTNSYSSTSDTLRLAVVGCGPRGLQCLESLTRKNGFDGNVKLEVTIFEPADFLGAGAVYNPRQPHHLRMNFATNYIDFWKTDVKGSPEGSTSLLSWLQHKYPKLDRPEGFVPRAVVGEYLHECFQMVLTRLRKFADVVIVCEGVNAIRASGSTWQVETESTSSEFDEVAITIGHEGLRECEKLSCDQTIPVFPVERHLSVDSIPAASRVLVNGFGLTAIDAIVTLTEGRGGAFDFAGEKLSYKPSGLEPTSIHVNSRTGRPMLAKPTAQIKSVPNAVWQPFTKRLNQLQPHRGELQFKKDVWPILCDASAALLDTLGSPTQSTDVDEWFQQWCDHSMDHDAAKAAMRDSYLVATGRQSQTIAYALGETWRRLYPPMVTLLGRGGLQPEDWRTFTFVAAEMERIAFGPPAENVARLLALMNAGFVHCGGDQADLPIDHEINAVIAPPHDSPSSGPLADLIRNRAIHRDQVSGAVMIDVDGRPIDSEGKRCDGLAIFGRVTEGWVIGNDTLSRTLHHHIGRWADTIKLKVHE